nr:hypothetical protein [Erwinia amylovora]
MLNMEETGSGRRGDAVIAINGYMSAYYHLSDKAWRLGVSIA